MKRHHLLLLLLALLAGLIIALLSHSVVSSAPLRITATPSPTPSPTATARTPTPQPAAVTYVVQRGDTRTNVDTDAMGLAQRSFVFRQ